VNRLKGADLYQVSDGADLERLCIPVACPTVKLFQPIQQQFEMVRYSLVHNLLVAIPHLGAKVPQEFRLADGRQGIGSDAPSAIIRLKLLHFCLQR
jgi:hypothetical protein